MRRQERALRHGKINHGSPDLSMPQQVLYCDDIDALFQEMSRITVSERMQVHIFSDGCFFQGFSHNPAQALLAVAAIGFPAIEQINMGVFCYQVLLEAFGNVVGQWNNAVFFILAFADVDGFTFKINIGDLQISGLLAAQSGRIDQGEQDAMF